jgi:prepilin-type N-terminal cleavage/methylation domain-containing protein
MRTSLKSRLGKGFTLIELLIVITIIGILAVALVPRISQGPARARDVTRKADLQNISNSLELLFSDTNAYPATTGWEATLTDYISAVPTDPSGVAVAYDYLWISDTSYVIAAKLETSTATGTNIASGCSSAVTTPAGVCPGSPDGEFAYYYLGQ